MGFVVGDVDVGKVEVVAVDTAAEAVGEGGRRGVGAVVGEVGGIGHLATHMPVARLAGVADRASVDMDFGSKVFTH